MQIGEYKPSKHADINHHQYLCEPNFAVIVMLVNRRDITVLVILKKGLNIYIYMAMFCKQITDISV